MIVDLRSDVFTRPTQDMLEAMKSGTFGDDVFQEDETVNRLQERVCQLTGKDAALFVVSGTMANQLAIASQTRPHDEVIVDTNSHIFQFEQGSPAVVSGVQLKTINFEGNLPNKDEMKDSIREYDIHHPISKMLCLEITHNADGGSMPDYQKMKKIVEIARSSGLKIHIDGARIWNAVTKSEKSIKDYAKLADTLMFCFSKGLGAPVGSVLVGSKETIERARYLRKGIGGGWRQPGWLAAAAIYSLENNIERLEEDHMRAQKIGSAIENNIDLEIIKKIETNMIYFRPRNGRIKEYGKYLWDAGILNDCGHFNAIRLVTHLNIDDKMTDYVIGRLS